MATEILKLTAEIVMSHASMSELSTQELVDEIKDVYNVLVSLEGRAVTEKPKHIVALADPKRGANNKVKDCWPATHLPDCNSVKYIPTCLTTCKIACKTSCQIACKTSCETGTCKTGCEITCEGPVEIIPPD